MPGWRVRRKNAACRHVQAAAREATSRRKKEGQSPRGRRAEGEGLDCEPHPGALGRGTAHLGLSAPRYRKMQNLRTPGASSLPARVIDEGINCKLLFLVQPRRGPHGRGTSFPRVSDQRADRTSNNFGRLSNFHQPVWRPALFRYGDIECLPVVQVRLLECLLGGERQTALLPEVSKPRLLLVGDGV